MALVTRQRRLGRAERHCTTGIISPALSLYNAACLATFRSLQPWLRVHKAALHVAGILNCDAASSRERGGLRSNTRLLRAQFSRPASRSGAAPRQPPTADPTTDERCDDVDERGSGGEISGVIGGVSGGVRLSDGGQT